MNEENLNEVNNHQYSLREVFYRVKEYAELNTTLFIFLTTVIVTGTSILVKLFFYAYQVGWNQFYNISNRYIEVTGNLFYRIGLYIAVSIIMVIFNVIANNFFERRQLFKYFFIFTLILNCVLFIVSLLSDFNGFINAFSLNLITTIMLSILLVFSLHCIAITNFLSPSKRVKVLRINILIERKEKKLEYLKSKVDKQNVVLNKIYLLRIRRILIKLSELKAKVEKLKDVKINRRKDTNGNNANNRLKETVK